MTQLLNVQEAMRRLSIKRTKLYDLFASGGLQSVRIGSRRFVLEGELERYVSALPSGNPASSSAGTSAKQTYINTTVPVPAKQTYDNPMDPNVAASPKSGDH